MVGFLLLLSSILFIVICAFLIFIILIQPGRAGGLASMTSQSIDAPSEVTETLGVQQTDKTMFRWTIGSAVTFMLLTLVMTYLGMSRDRAVGALDLKDKATPAAETAPAHSPAAGGAGTTVNTVVPAEASGSSGMQAAPSSGS